MAIIIIFFVEKKYKKFDKIISIPQLLLLFLVFLLGSYLLINQFQDQNDFYTFVENKKCSITGKVSNKGWIKNNNRFFITIDIHEIKHKNTIKAFDKKIIFYLLQEINLDIGDIVLFSNVTFKSRPSNEFNNYLIKESIGACVFLNSPEFILLQHPSWCFQRFIFSHRQRLIDQLKNKLSSETFDLFAPLFLGYRNTISEKLTDQFKTWGLSHLLARSGLHLTIFVLIWQTILRIIPISFAFKQLFITMLCLLYILFSWTSIPFVRAFILFILYKKCIFLRIPFHFLHYLSLAAFCLLIYCPINLFFLDFQLTFALTAALAWHNQLHFSYKIKS